MLRAINTAGLSEVEKRVVKATYDDADPPKLKHVEALILLSSDTDLIPFIDKRLINPQWNIAFKALVVMHRLMQEGNPRLLSDLIDYPSLFELPQSFDSGTDYEAATHSKFIGFYARYLTAKVSAFRVLNVSIERSQTNEAKKWARKLTTGQLVKAIPILQSQFTAVLKVAPRTPEDQRHPIAIAAMSCVIKDAFRVYSILTLLMMIVLEKYESMTLTQTQAMLAATNKFIVQNRKFRLYSNQLAKIGFVQKKLLPDFDAIPETFLQLLEEHIVALGGVVENPTVIEEETPAPAPAKGKGRKSSPVQREDDGDYEEDVAPSRAARKSPPAATIARPSTGRTARQSPPPVIDDYHEEEQFEEQKDSRPPARRQSSLKSQPTTSSAPQARRSPPASAAAQYQSQARAPRGAPAQQQYDEEEEEPLDDPQPQRPPPRARKPAAESKSASQPPVQRRPAQQQQQQQRPSSRPAPPPMIDDYDEEQQYENEQYEEEQQPRAAPRRPQPPPPAQQPPPTRNARAPRPPPPIDAEDDYLDELIHEAPSQSSSHDAADVLSMFAPPTPMNVAPSQPARRTGAAPLTARSRAAARAAIQSTLNNELNLFEDFDPSTLHPAEEEALNRQQQEINDSLAFFNPPAAASQPAAISRSQSKGSSVPATPPPRYEPNRYEPSEPIFDDVIKPSQPPPPPAQPRAPRPPRATQQHVRAPPPPAAHEDEEPQFSDPFADLNAGVDPATFQPVLNSGGSNAGGGARRTKAQAAAAGTRVPRRKPAPRVEEDYDDDVADDYT